MPDLGYRQYNDFVYIQKESTEEILQELLSQTKDNLSSFTKYASIEDIQVLSPMKRGVIGTENLNHNLQKVLNPHGESLEYKGHSFRVKDKVMQIRNNYDKKVYNGDVGYIDSIDFQDKEVVVLFDRKEVIYNYADLDELVLSYACSIHKYQGSECKCIIIPLHMSHFKLLFRNLLYTGITRGKKLVVLIGSKKAISYATGNDYVQKRYTGLKAMIQNLS